MQTTHLSWTGSAFSPTSGNNGDNGTVYGTENEGFNKIESFGGSGTAGPDWFQVTTKDGKIMEYGHAYNTTLLTDNYQSNMVWLLNKVTDINGNYETFQYSVNNTDRNFAITEIDYTGNTPNSILPNTRITFTYNVKPNWQKTKMYQSGAAMASPFILYGISVINPSGTTVKSFQCAYTTVRDQYFLTSFIEYGADGTSLNPLKFTYGSNTTAADVDVSPSYGSFTYNNTFTGDITGDGKEDIVAAYFQYDNNNIPKYKEYYVFDNFSTYNGQAALSYAYHYPMPTWGTSNAAGQLVRYFGGYYSFLTSDYDGDTKRDVLMSNWTISGADMIFDDISINYSKYYGAITGTLPQTQPYNNIPHVSQYANDFKYSYRNGSSFGTNLIPGDFDGDGAQDYILILGINNTNAFKAFFSSPQKGIINQEILNFGVEGSPSDPFYANSVASATDVAPIDFNGDGKTEILVQKANQSYVLSVYPLPPSTGSYWAASILYTTTAIKSGYRVFPGDFNGDGATDLLVRSSKTDPNAAWNFLYSTGTQFRSFPFLYTKRPTLDGDAGGFTNVNMLMVGDFNGDGKSDVWQSLDDASGGLHSIHILYYSNGIPVDGGNSTSAFTVETYTRPESINKSPQAQTIVGDINGDGKQDLMSLLGNNSRIIYPKPFKEDRLMTSATDGFGSISSFAYELMNNSYHYQRSSDYEYDNSATPIGQGQNGNPYNVLKTPMYLLTDITAPDGIGGTTYVDYDYQDAVYSPIRGFLGFKQVAESTPYGTITNFSEIDPSLLVSHTVRQLSTFGSNVMSDMNITDEFVMLGTSYFDKRYVHHINTTLTQNGVTGSAIESTNTYDNYGNITDNIIKKGYVNGYMMDLERIETQTTYTSHPISQIPALPQSIFVSSYRYGQSTVTKTNTNTYTGSGQLLSSTDFAGNALAVTSNYTYDNFGNVATISVNAPNTLTPVVTNTYDATGRFLTKKEITASGITKTETYTYEPTWGLPATIVSSDGLTKGFIYDNSFGRPIKSILPDGNSVSQTMAWETSGNFRYSIAAQRDADGGLYMKEYYDIKDRKIQTEKSGFNGQLLTANTAYDYRGQVASHTDPFYANETPITTTNTYDGYGRPTGSSNGTSSVTTAYSQLGNGHYQVTTTNGAGQSSSKVQDGAGKILWTSDDGGFLGFYYDSWGNQISVTLGIHTLMSSVYDAYGRQTSQTDKNAGTIVYEYDALGKPTKQTDANGNISTMLYDGFGRTASRMGPEGTTSYEYFTNGNLYSDAPTKITGPSGDITEFTYDNLMRKASQKTTVDGISYTDQYEYDSYSNLVKTTYHSGIIVHDIYDNNSIPIKTTLEDGGSTRDIFTATAMNSKGIYTGYTLGNGSTSQVDYDLALGTPTRYYTPGIQDLNMAWDAQRGNLSSRSDAIRSLYEDFTYDNLNRLTGATGNARPPLAINYDNDNGNSHGNITSKTDAGDYTYRNDKIHAVGFISNPAGAQVPPSVISTQTQQLTYTPFLKTATIDQNGYLLNYTYGSDQQRIKSVLQQNSSTIETKYYIGTYERQIIPGVADRYIHYINAGNGLAAIAVKENGVTNVYYAYSDHLGSVLTLTDASGNIIAKQNFDAWGRYRNPDDWTYNNVPTNNPTWLYRGFTGHEHLNTFALINMNGRMYDPVQGRMLSPDNYVPLPWNTQGYNGYSYANNNPLNHVDPDGNFFWLIVAAAAIIGSYTGASVQQGTLNPAHWNSNWWKGAVTGAIIGASLAVGVGAIVSGSALYSTTGVAGQIALGAAKGVGSSILSSELTSLASGNGLTWNWDNMFISVTSGAVTGAITSGPVSNFIDSKTGIASIDNKIWGTKVSEILSGIGSRLLANTFTILNQKNWTKVGLKDVLKGWEITTTQQLTNAGIDAITKEGKNKYEINPWKKKDGKILYNLIPTFTKRFINQFTTNTFNENPTFKGVFDFNNLIKLIPAGVYSLAIGGRTTPSNDFWSSLPEYPFIR